MNGSRGLAGHRAADISGRVRGLLDRDLRDAGQPRAVPVL